MKAPISWLKDFVEINETPKKLAEIFTLLGAEVENIDGDTLSLEITPNRSDWLSICGLARELAAYWGKKVVKPEISKLKYSNKSQILDIVFSDKKLFPAYAAVVLENIEIKPSPEYIQERLKKVGIKIHNNIIDTTNYVMMALGLPLHAFDLDDIIGQKMILRESKTGEKLKTLDDQQREPPAGSLVIEDDKRLIDLMGIKGGANSGVKPSTKRVLLQATVDDPKRIRAASKAIGLVSEASYRFERGVDQEMIRPSLEMAVGIILNSCAGKVIEAFDIINCPTPKRVIKIDYERVINLLGTQIDKIKSQVILGRLGFGVDGSKIEVPSWRLHDIFFEEDLIEEIARHYGYNRLKRKIIDKKRAVYYDDTVEKFLVNAGFTQALTYSFLSKKEVADGAISLIKPLSPETAFLRTSLVPGLIKTAARNAWSKEIKIFETGNIFTPEERKYIALASTGELPNNLPNQKITPDQRLAKLNKLRRSLNITQIPYSQFLKNVSIITASYKHKKISYRPISQFPPAARDIAFIVSTASVNDKMTQAIKDADERLVIVELFDEFTSEKFGRNKKSLCYHLVFDDRTRTLNNGEVARIMDKINKMLQNNFGAKIR